MTIKSTSALLVEAMREAIKQEIITYKLNSVLICNICNSTNEIYEDYHVDHSSPSFKTIKDNFLKDYKENIPMALVGNRLIWLEKAYMGLIPFLLRSTKSTANGLFAYFQ
jgi:hypothetical protein